MATRSSGGDGGDEILDTLVDFTSKENWDKFFALRGAGDSFEWYAEWPSLRPPLLSLLNSSAGGAGIEILVPGCGNSAVSEHLYDAGFRRITNIDFSKVVVADMLRRNVRCRPEMKWRVMDMTEMLFADMCFDVVLDKGGLDALMEPEHGFELGRKYLREVQKVLKSGGKYLCLTLAESHVVGLLLSEFRFGWETSIDAIHHKPHEKPTFNTFIVTIVKHNLEASNPVISVFSHSSLKSNAQQVHSLVKAIENENTIRSKYLHDAGILYYLEDLKLGAKGNLKELHPGRRCKLILGEKGNSLYSYKTVLLDAKEIVDAFLYHCGVFIVPKIRAHEWLFTSEEGQWQVVESSKAARLIMVFLDSRHAHARMSDIQSDLSPLVIDLAPGKPDDEAKIPFMMASDGVKQRFTVKQVTSNTTGPIVVEDVIYEDLHDNSSSISPGMMIRRLTFERSAGLVQSEAVLIRGEKQSCPDETERDKIKSSSKSKKKGARKRNESSIPIDGSRSNLKVDHYCLASSYHSGIVSGFALIASDLESAVTSGKKIKAVIIGLGAGLLPMFLHGHLPFLDIEVVELDPVISDLARNYFGFTEDERLKVHIGDGIAFIRNTNVGSTSNSKCDNGGSDIFLSNGKSATSDSNGSESVGTKILIIDADSSDLSSGLTCPPADFVEESFLLSVKNFLSEGGLFVTNLVSRSQAIRDMVASRIRAVFGHVFSLELEEDVNEVLFASPKPCIEVEQLTDAAARVQKLSKFSLPERCNKQIRNIKLLR